MYICRRPIFENCAPGGQKRFYAGMPNGGLGLTTFADAYGPVICQSVKLLFCSVPQPWVVMVTDFVYSVKNAAGLRII